LLYATEQADEENSPETRDIQNEAFWKKLSSIFQETQEMITEWAEEEGLDAESEIDRLPGSRPQQQSRKRTHAFGF